MAALLEMKTNLGLKLAYDNLKICPWAGIVGQFVTRLVAKPHRVSAWLVFCVRIAELNKSSSGSIEIWSILNSSGSIFNTSATSGWSTGVLE